MTWRQQDRGRLASWETRHFKRWQQSRDPDKENITSHNHMLWVTGILTNPNDKQRGSLCGKTFWRGKSQMCNLYFLSTSSESYSKIYYSATSCPINFHCECITVNEFCARFTIKEQVRSIYQPLRCIEHRTFLQVKSIKVAEMSGLEKGTQYFMAWAAGLWVSMAFRSMTDSLIISAVSRLSLIDRHRRLSWKFIFIFSNCKQKY